MARTLRPAVAQSTVPEDSTDRGALRAARQEIRALMAEAAGAGAHLVQFPEGVITYPGKHATGAGPGLFGAAVGRCRGQFFSGECGRRAGTAGRLPLPRSPVGTGVRAVTGQRPATFRQRALIRCCPVA